MLVVQILENSTTKVQVPLARQTEHASLKAWIHMNYINYNPVKIKHIACEKYF